jgi:hypothetical protein
MTLTHLAEPNMVAMLLEAAMLICFGVAWPLANLRMIRSGRVEGKGMAFTVVILCGYVAGALAKLAPATSFHALPPVFWLYVLNTISVGLNVVLQWRLATRRAAPIGLTTAG